MEDGGSDWRDTVPQVRIFGSPQQLEEAGIIFVVNYFSSPKKLMGFPGSSVVKNPPANAGTGVQSLGREDPLEKEMATHSSILAWKIPWTEEPGGLQVQGIAKSQT